MKLKKNFWLRTVPVLIIVITTCVVSVPVYNKMVESETETCWERLEIATRSTGVKILLVEDNEFNMEIAEVLLSDAGAVVTTATDGNIATERIRKMDRPAAKTMPIIAMTASAFAEEVKCCKEVGMNEHLAKPLDIDKLIQLVAKYCNR